MKLYHYQHCPYCVRVRMIIGWKGLQIEEEVLANADEQRHYDLVGVKVVPILQRDDGSCLKESLDIVCYLDRNFGQPLLLDRAEDYQQGPLGQWLERIAEPVRQLVHPRNIRIFAQDFPRQQDRDYYETKKSQSIGPFEQALAGSAKYIAQVKEQLEQLPPSYISAEAIEQRSYADILLFPVLRSLTHVAGLSFPPQVGAYLQERSRQCQVDLLFDRAI